MKKTSVCGVFHIHTVEIHTGEQRNGPARGAVKSWEGLSFTRWEIINMLLCGWESLRARNKNNAGEGREKQRPYKLGRHGTWSTSGGVGTMLLQEEQRMWVQRMWVQMKEH